MSRLNEAKRGDAVRDGPTWLQRLGCGFVTGVKLEAAGRRRVERGKSDLYFDAARCLAARPGEGEYIRDKYAPCEAATKNKPVKERTEVDRILSYTARASPATCDPEQGVARDVRNVR